jgi:hypothetical protein
MGYSTYTPGIPLGTDKPSNSAPQFANNFTTINQQYGHDHVQFNGGDPARGTHQFVTFNAPSADPSYVSGPTQPVFQNSNSRLYTKSFGSGTTSQELYFAITTSGGTAAYPLIPSFKVVGAYQLNAGETMWTQVANTLNVNVKSISKPDPVTVEFNNNLLTTAPFVYCYLTIGSRISIVFPSTITVSTLVFPVGIFAPNAILNFVVF